MLQEQLEQALSAKRKVCWITVSLSYCMSWFQVENERDALADELASKGGTLTSDDRRRYEQRILNLEEELEESETNGLFCNIYLSYCIIRFRRVDDSQAAHSTATSRVVDHRFVDGESRGLQGGEWSSDRWTIGQRYGFYHVTDLSWILYWLTLTNAHL